MASDKRIPEKLPHPGGIAELDYNDGYIIGWNECVDAMPEASPQPDTVEPSAWKYEVVNGYAFSTDKGRPACVGWDEEADEPIYGKITPLYAHPPAQPDTETEERELLRKIVHLADEGLIQESGSGSHIAPLFFDEARALLDQEK